MLDSVLSTDIYIFKAMMPQSGYDILENHLPSNYDALKANGESLWLIRESNILGMLTIDYMRYDASNMSWSNFSTRMALTAGGWVSASQNADSIQLLRHITAETASKHQDSLSAYIQSLGFKVAYRINPLKIQQTTCGIYSTYIVCKKPGSNKIDLTPGLAQAISCELTSKPFKKPVVLNKNMRVRVEGWKFIDLYQGRSYEESEIIKLSIPQDSYCRNFVLEKAIDRLGCNDIAKIKMLSEDRLLDSVLLDVIKDPVILPSGHSYGKDVINEMVASGRSLRCPNTAQPFSVNDVIPNINLDNFMKEWPACKEMMLHDGEANSSQKLNRMKS